MRPVELADLLQQIAALAATGSRILGLGSILPVTDNTTTVIGTLPIDLMNGVHAELSKHFSDRCCVSAPVLIVAILAANGGRLETLPAILAVSDHGPFRALRRPSSTRIL